MRKLLLMSFVMVLALLQQAYAQNRTVSGTVTDQGTSQGLPGVAVIVKGTTVGTTTGADGTYSINVPADGNTLVFRFIGYQTLEKAIGNATTINASMATDQKLLDEVVVVGYGTQQKKDVTSSIASVKGSDLANLATPSFDQQLAGRASGVQITQPSGILGAPPKINIRGVNSISSSTQPLIVIDGVPAAASGNVGGFTPANALADINPNDIESFEILKDGAATAVYGSRAANGVILITTKKGKSGQAKFTYDGWAGTAKAIELHDLLNAQQFVDITNEKYSNIGQTSPAAMGEWDTDWNDEVFRTAFQHSHAFSASGGSEKNTYYFSLGYSNQEGIGRANSLERYSVRTNLTTKVTKFLDFGLQAGLTNQINQGPLTGSNNLSGNIFGVIRMHPNVPVYNPEHPTGYNIDFTEPRALGRGPNSAVVANGIPNIRFVLDNNVRKATSYRGLGNVYLDFKLVDNLRFKTLLGADLSMVDDFLFNDPRHGDGQGSGGVVSQAYSPVKAWNWQNILSYNKTLGDVHNFDGTLVQEYNKYRSSFFQAQGTGLSDRFFNENLVSGAFANQFASGGIGENGLSSYLARFNYNFASKYYFGVSMRADGLSKLSPDNKWGYFPGVSAAYRISEEEFFKNSSALSFISDLRLRGSYAEVGNINIPGGNYPYLGSFSAAQYGSMNGIAFSNTGNPDLRWEAQKITDVGMDLGLFDGRLNLELAYWVKDNSDIVLAAPTPPSLGVPGNSIIRNIGRVVNNGIEFAISGNVIDKSNFTWNSNFNFSTQNNEVKELVAGNDIVYDYTIHREGESINSIYGYQYEGVNQVNGNPIYRKADGTFVQGNISGNGGSAGVYYVYDPANPTVLGARSSLSAADKAILGTTLPKWFGGFDNNFKYGNFDANIFVRFSGGNKIMNRTRQDLLTMAFENNGTEILNRWQSPEKPGDGQTPKLAAGAGYSNFINTNGEASSRFVESGDFLKVSNLALGYTLPKSITERASIERLRIYAQLQNAFVFTDYSGLDPETYTNLNNGNLGVDWNGQPQQRVFTVGLNLGF
ncbi:SusC/RagA family TonB-linked outer membrane protein [Pontibacter anaerobius]|uniref:TonB-dependent receptor n=1 Tax=Pontibacter anaerobius TaxID=2993940 RepID=A0ABT3RBL2_9BACT|nr:TonB-dependent receptor [Pontibacter anaerobius]MCX2738757.1 TonB-dependent receptor [Pontibacter anaerobius]